ncbi:MAG TPA: methyltransferase domain-containing protein [Solirubrobacteraceae bacterium]
MLRPDSALVAIADVLKGAVALEPGGPSALFKRHGMVPVYPRLEALDTLDFSDETLWSGGQGASGVRRKLIGEARRLESVSDGAYDALLASHVLEHLADPLGALGEWQRVVRPGGHVLLVMPHYEGTFDHNRPVTSVEHMRADAERETGEDDLTHLEEIIELHDLARDPGAPHREAFEQRCRENLATRGMHHHVFDSRSVVELCRAAGLEVIAMRPKPTFNIVCLCRVGSGNGQGLDDRELAKILAESPFESDRAAA